MPRRLVAFLSLSALAACGPAPTPITPTPAVTTTAIPTVTAIAPTAAIEPPDTTPRPVFDPLATGMTKEGVTALCDDHLARAQVVLGRLRALKGAPAEKLTYASTLGRFDEVVLELNSAGEFPYLMGVAHPDAAVREAAKLCEPKTDKLTTAIWLDADVAGVLKAYAARGEKLEGERAKLLTDVLRDFRRNGLDLPPAKQQRLRALNEQITRVGQEFQSNIGASTSKIEVKPGSLAGLPKEYLAKRPPNKEGRVVITTDYPDFFPFMTYSKDRKAALDLYVLFTNRGGDANVKLLERILSLRSEKAKLLGYATWADYAIEPRMAKTAKNVHDFLDRLQVALKEPARLEMAEFMAEHVKLGGKATDKLPPSERYYLEDRVRRAKYKFDSQELSNYLELGAVKKGLMDITARMYGLEYREVPANAWHPDVTAYEVWSGGAMIGKFYLDLYSRPDKYKHAAMFTVRTAARLPDGTYQRPIAALECNFPKPGEPVKGKAPAPALMSHEDTVTFFHEFGHVLHQILTRSELAYSSGTATARDFVEAPSQMFEEWAWSREVLDLFAKHHKTGKKIPDSLFSAMQKARGYGRALSTQRQLFLATLDVEYHTREPGFDTTKVVEEVQNATDSFTYVPGTHFQSSFGHLIGYDAAYYGYQWALSLSQDVLTRFKAEGLLNPATAASWRDEVLAKGGGADERAMITRFLGREPTPDAYLAYLRGKD
jgi:thimet oligopeptidase